MGGGGGGTHLRHHRPSRVGAGESTVFHENPLQVVKMSQNAKMAKKTRFFQSRRHPSPALRGRARRAPISLMRNTPMREDLAIFGLSPKIAKSAQRGMTPPNGPGEIFFNTGVKCVKMSMYNAGKIYKFLFPIFFTSAFLPIVGTADRRKSSRKIVKSRHSGKWPPKGPSE